MVIVSLVQRAFGREDADADGGEVPAVAITVEAAPPSFKSLLRESFIASSPYLKEIAGCVLVESSAKQLSIKTCSGSGLDISIPNTDSDIGFFKCKKNLIAKNSG